MTAIRVVGILVASLAVIGVAEAQKGGGKPGGKNTPPTGSISDISVTVNSPDLVIDLYAAYSDAQDPDTALAYAVTGNTNPSLFNSVTIDSANGTLTLSYATDAVGVADVTLQVTDTGGRTLDDTFAITVSNGVLLREEFSHGFNEAWSSDPIGLYTNLNYGPFEPWVNRGSMSVQFDPSGLGAELVNRQTQNFSKYGFSSYAEFPSNVIAEARIKTPPVNGPGINDGLFYLAIVDSADKTKFVAVGLQGGSGDGQWCYEDSIGLWYLQCPGFFWGINTWYRFVIDDDPQQGLVVSIWNDDLTEKLVSNAFGYSLSDLGSSFNIVFLQRTDGLSRSMQVTVDFIEVRKR